MGVNFWVDVYEISRTIIKRIAVKMMAVHTRGCVGNLPVQPNSNRSIM